MNICLFVVAKSKTLKLFKFIPLQYNEIITHNIIQNYSQPKSNHDITTPDPHTRPRHHVTAQHTKKSISKRYVATCVMAALDEEDPGAAGMREGVAAGQGAGLEEGRDLGRVQAWAIGIEVK